MTTTCIYIFVSRRGFGNEGTIYTVPREHEKQALATLHRLLGDNVDAWYRRVTRADAARRVYADPGVRFAHTEGWDAGDAFTHDEIRADAIRASAFLWDRREEVTHEDRSTTQRVHRREG